MGKTANTLQDALTIRNKDGERNVVDALYAIADAIQLCAGETERQADAINHLAEAIKRREPPDVPAALQPEDTNHEDRRDTGS